MLTEVRIHNFAIIESLALPLAPALNVLSGETGAGKSIIVGALAFLLGERASADVVRSGSERAVVEGVFDVGTRGDVVRLLDERGIDPNEGILVLRRELSTVGRTRAWANGSVVTAAVLSELGRMLVSLHGQHEAQTLVDTDSQRRVLDAFAGATEVAAAVRDHFHSLAAVRAEITALAATTAEAERRADYLRYVVADIEQNALVPGEEDRLDEEARRLEHAEELRSLASGVAAMLEGDDDAALPRLSAVQRSLAALTRIDPSLSGLQETYDSGYYALSELANAVAAYLDTVERDPARLDEVNRRRDVIFRLKKKYGATVEEVLETARRARADLDRVDSAGADRAALETRERMVSASLDAEAQRLSGLRAAAADKLSAATNAIFPDLGMSGGQLFVARTPRATIGATGAEDVEFRVALNAGHEPRPLARVASGGELSRVMLALKTILAALDHVPTLVFDEVDAGIGGRVALLVADSLRRVADSHQVFVISHLPQIASRAQHHIQVTKGAPAGVTTADVRVLTGEARVTEIARMLGGDPESDVSRRHARELLQAAAPTRGKTARRGADDHAAPGAR